MARSTQFPIMITRSTIIYEIVSPGAAGVIGSDVPWLECPACNALTWVI